MKKGVALLWVLVLSAVFMLIAGTMVTTITKEARFSVRIEESTKAYAAAKTGIDWARNQLLLDSNYLTGVNGQQIKVDGTCPGADCVIAVVKVYKPLPTSPVVVSSQGESSGVQRKLEYDVSSVIGKTIVPSDPNNIEASGLNDGSGGFLYTNKESFSLQFDFWFSDDGIQPVVFGLDDGEGASSNSIALNIQSSGAAFLEGLSKSSEINHNIGSYNAAAPPSSPLPTDFNPKSPYSYRAEISYLQGTAASIKIKAKDASESQYARYLCLGYASIDLKNQVLDFYSFHITTVEPSAYINNGTQGDGSYIGVGTASAGGPKIFIDNIVLTQSNYYSRAGYVPPSSIPPSSPTVMDFEGLDPSAGWIAINPYNEKTYSIAKVAESSEIIDPSSTAIAGTKSLFTHGGFPHWLGGDGCTPIESDTYDAVMYRDIILPNAASRLTFKLKSSIGSSSYGDKNRITIYNQTGGGTLIKEWSTAIGDLITGTSVNYGPTTTYQFDFNEAYAGKTIRFYARSHVGCWQASMVVDDINIQ